MRSWTWSKLGYMRAQGPASSVDYNQIPYIGWRTINSTQGTSHALWVRERIMVKNHLRKSKALYGSTQQEKQEEHETALSLVCLVSIESQRRIISGRPRDCMFYYTWGEERRLLEKEVIVPCLLDGSNSENLACLLTGSRKRETWKPCNAYILTYRKPSPSIPFDFPSPSFPLPLPHPSQ